MLRHSFRCGELCVEVHDCPAELGTAAGTAVATEIRSILARQQEASVVFASAASQNELLACLRDDRTIDWKRVVAFHLDEYIGLAADHPASFRRFLKDRLLNHVPVKQFYELAGETNDLAAECARYASLLEEKKPGLVVLGIGENGHLAFVDPHSCDFQDPNDVRVVDLDEDCRRQQVHDGAFERLDDVPGRALTLTVPFFLRVPRAVVAVPGVTKKVAVKEAIEGPISEACPASALRRHQRATLYLDSQSSGLLARTNGAVHKECGA